MSSSELKDLEQPENIITTIGKYTETYEVWTQEY